MNGAGEELLAGAAGTEEHDGNICRGDALDSLCDLLHLWSRRPHPRGAIFLGYLALYSVYRFIDEIFRKGATSTVWAYGITHAQLFSLISLPIILFFLTSLYRKMSDAPMPVDLAAWWARLGIHPTSDGVRFDDSAPLAAIRRSVTAP